MNQTFRAPDDSGAWSPHPEGGSFAPVWRSALELPADAVPEHPGPRAAGSCIAYRLAPGEHSRWHRVRSTELWLWQGGGDLRLLTGGVGHAPELERTLRLGPQADMQAVIAPGEWQSAEPVGGLAVVVACVVVPGFDWADWEVWSGS
ncbi:MAG TPA: cupin domain-containing protein [Frankiaceae bacterium]|nr:cupin domain-containing protein [Frankiaceae bacterium]